jgi:hypothetical protein
MPHRATMASDAWPRFYKAVVVNSGKSGNLKRSVLWFTIFRKVGVNGECGSGKQMIPCLLVVSPDARPAG